MRPRTLALVALVTLAACTSHAAPAPATPPATPPTPPTPASARCGPATADFYTPPPLPELSPQALGTILRCETIDTASAADLAATPVWRGAAPPDTPAAFGYHRYRILYLSQGPIGKPAAVSAQVYLPTGPTGHCPRGTGAPIAAVQHGTTGVADSCAPSKNSMSFDAVGYMALPLVGRGMAVVATDYQGLGTPGLHPYLVGESEAYSVLDGVRALAKLQDDALEPGCLGHDVVMVGHSQGGQATLFAEGLAASYGMGADMKLGGAVAWAPGFGARIRGTPVKGDTKTSMGTAFYAMYLYAAATYRGGPPPSTWLTPEAQKQLPDLLEHECIFSLFMAVPAKFPTLGTLFTRSFLDQPGADPWGKYVAADVPGQQKTPAPTLIVQGTNDDIVPGVTTRCIVDRMTKLGDRVDTCVKAANHLSIVALSWADILPWIDAAAHGRPPPAPPEGCAGSLPACIAP